MAGSRRSRRRSVSRPTAVSAATAAPPPSAGPPPSGIQAQPLPPPPGAHGRASAAQRARASPPPANPAGQPANPPPPQPADTSPQSDDTVVTETPTQKIANGRAVFSGLDKITGRIISFDAAIGETVQFGALQVTARACYTRPPTEATNTDAFVDVDEVTLKGEIKRIFTGWMFASSPGLHAVEHPIYDVWLTDCSQPVQAPAPVAQSTTPPPAPAAPAPQRPRQPPAPRPVSPPHRAPAALTPFTLRRGAPARHRRTPADRAPARRNLPRRQARHRAACDRPAA